MKRIKLTNPVKADDKQPKLMKKTAAVEYEERDYYPVMIELAHLLEKTHTIAHEEEIISRIQELEEQNPESRAANGILWQTVGTELNLLLDEKTLTAYQAIFEEYLDPAVVANLKNFLEATNHKRQAEYESADETEKERFKKINVVTLN